MERLADGDGSVLAGDVAQEFGRLGQRGEGGGDNLSAGERLVAALATRGRSDAASGTSAVRPADGVSGGSGA